MNIYTKTGDDGSTGLFGGQRVAKNDPRIECYGTVDELNAAIGLAIVGAEISIADKLRPIQDELFVLGSQLATPEESPHRDKLPVLSNEMIQRLEEQIDAAESVLQPLKQFILPGGSETSARLHLARTICRRAERLLVSFAQHQTAPPLSMMYLNRLSDWLFVHARLANHLAGVVDVPWRK